MRFVFQVFAFLLVCLTTPAKADPLLELGAGMYRLNVEVAHTDGARARGLMYRKQMADHQGMLFVFPTRAAHCMWMKNTDLPLAVAFIDDSGKIINIEEMRPHTENNHCAAKAARYALEMNTGWFKRRGIEAGALIRGLDKAPEPQ